jgi:hypothetical protein
MIKHRHLRFYETVLTVEIGLVEQRKKPPLEGRLLMRERIVREVWLRGQDLNL